MKTKVIVCTEYSEQARAELLTRFGDRFDITFDEHAASLGDAEICIGEPPLALVQQAEKLRWVQMTWAGTDIYTRRTGFPERVTLTNASGAFGRTISEYVLGGILTMYRNFPAYREQQKQAVWRTVGAERTLYGRTVLILGTGDLGSNVAKRLRGFGTVNIGVRRAAGETLPYFDEVRGIAELDELLPQADIVIGCLPNTPGTTGLLTETRLRRMKQDALLVNVAGVRCFRPLSSPPSLRTAIWAARCSMCAIPSRSRPLRRSGAWRTCCSRPTFRDAASATTAAPNASSGRSSWTTSRGISREKNCGIL